VKPSDTLRDQDEPKTRLVCDGAGSALEDMLSFRLRRDCIGPSSIQCGDRELGAPIKKAGLVWRHSICRDGTGDRIGSTTAGVRERARRRSASGLPC
jgi:hypothetical protein